MSEVVPTITAENPHAYREQIERVEGFAKRIHIDLMDGVFTPNRSVSIEQVWLPKDLICDVHLMFAEPESAVLELATLEPNLIIIPAEALFNLNHIVRILKGTSIKLGLALLPETTIESVSLIIREVDHLLIFSGNLGHQGGSNADLNLLKKASKALELNPKLEIGWDGGINETNIQSIANGGVTVLNSGGFIHSAKNPREAFQILLQHA